MGMRVRGRVRGRVRVGVRVRGRVRGRVRKGLWGERGVRVNVVQSEG